MIERQKVNGRDATVAYLASDFNPVDKTKATMVKLIFDDGDIYFLFPAEVMEKSK